MATNASKGADNRSACAGLEAVGENLDATLWCCEHCCAAVQALNKGAVDLRHARTAAQLGARHDKRVRQPRTNNSARDACGGWPAARAAERIVPVPGSSAKRRQRALRHCALDAHGHVQARAEEPHFATRVRSFSLCSLLKPRGQKFFWGSFARTSAAWWEPTKQQESIMSYLVSIITTHTAVTSHQRAC